MSVQLKSVVVEVSGCVWQRDTTDDKSKSEDCTVVFALDDNRGRLTWGVKQMTGHGSSTLHHGLDVPLDDLREAVRLLTLARGSTEPKA
jgi:hypothetical protein